MFTADVFRRCTRQNTAESVVMPITDRPVIQEEI